MNKWKIAFIVCVIMLIISNLYLSYQLLDTGVTNTYNSDTIEKKENAIRILGDIITEKGNTYSKKDILFLLRQKFPKRLIVQDSNKISYEGIEFIFDNDSLVIVTDSW